MFQSNWRDASESEFEKLSICVCGRFGKTSLEQHFCQLFPEFQFVARIAHEDGHVFLTKSLDETKTPLIWISTQDKATIPKDVDVVIWLKEGTGEDLSVVETQNLNHFVFFTFADQMLPNHRDKLRAQLNSKSFLMSAKTGEGVKHAFQQVIASHNQRRSKE